MDWILCPETPLGILHYCNLAGGPFLRGRAGPASCTICAVACSSRSTHWSLLQTFNKSKNFVSDDWIRMPQIIPTIHYHSFKNQLNTAAIRIQYSMLLCSVHMHARNILIYSKWIASIEHTAQSNTAVGLNIMLRTSNIFTPRMDRSPSAYIKLRAF